MARRHRLTLARVNGGTRYACSCGWSQGWIQGGRLAARRINRIAHRTYPNKRSRPKGRRFSETPQ